jgi:hypothetical protein
MGPSQWPATKVFESQRLIPIDLPDGLIFRIRVKPRIEKYFSFSES